MVDYVQELELEYPVDDVAVIKFRRPKRPDLRGLHVSGDDGMDVDELIALAERISDQLPDVWKQMDAADAMKAAGVAATFLGGGPTT